MGDDFMGQSWKVNILNTKCVLFVFVISCIVEYILTNIFPVNGRDALQILVDICSIFGFLLTLLLAKTAKGLMLKIKILYKANQWAGKKEIVLQDLQGYSENIVTRKIYSESIRNNLLTIIEELKTCEEAFSKDTKVSIDELLMILKNDLQCSKREKVASLISSLLGKIKDDQSIDRLLEILDD